MTHVKKTSYKISPETSFLVLVPKKEKSLSGDIHQHQTPSFSIQRKDLHTEQ